MISTDVIRKVNMSFVRSFSCQQLQKRSWGRRNALMRKKIQTKNVRQVGSQTFPVIYCSIYILRIVSKWEDEKEKWEEMTARRDEAGHIQMKINIHMEGLWTCARAASSHAPLIWKVMRLGKGQSFPDFSGSVTSIWVVFVVHVNTFTITTH